MLSSQNSIQLPGIDISVASLFARFNYQRRPACRILLRNFSYGPNFGPNSRISVDALCMNPHLSREAMLMASESLSHHEHGKAGIHQGLISALLPPSGPDKPGYNLLPRAPVLLTALLRSFHESRSDTDLIYLDSLVHHLLVCNRPVARRVWLPGLGSVLFEDVIYLPSLAPSWAKLSEVVPRLNSMLNAKKPAPLFALRRF